jgi:hypothetical protein
VQVFQVGDLLIRERDKRPCVVLEVGESTKKEWGTLHANRRLYRLFEAHSGVSSWVVDTEIKANYTLPP